MGNEQSSKKEPNENEPQTPTDSPGGFWDGLIDSMDVSKLVKNTADLGKLLSVDEEKAIAGKRVVVLAPPADHSVSPGLPAMTMADVEGLKLRVLSALRGWCAPPEAGGAAFTALRERRILSKSGRVRIFVRDVEALGADAADRSALEVVALMDLPIPAARVFPCVWDPAEYVQHDYHFVDIRALQLAGEGASPAATGACATAPEAAAPYRVMRYLGKSLPWPLKTVVLQRDVVAALHASSFTTRDGTTGYVMAMQDTIHPDCTEAAEDVVRAHMIGTGGFVAVPHPEDSERCLLGLVQAIDLGGGLPRELVDVVLRRSPPKWAVRIAKHVRRNPDARESVEDLPTSAPEPAAE